MRHITLMAAVLVILALGGPTGARALGADPAEAAFAHPNPAAVIGRLPNGVRYTILRHPSHNKETLDFYVEAGSRDESDQELGYAHFIEHMAFVASGDVGGRRLIDDFARAGVAWGGDLNAFTTYQGTLYTLNLPEVDDSKLDLAFAWFGRIAKGLDLAPSDVDKEREVILQEYVRGLGAQRDVSRASERFTLPHVRGPRRPPIGEEGSIRSASAAGLRRFYETWYRPETVIVIAVGDAPEAAVKRRIMTAFGDWKAKRPPAPRPDPGTVDFHRPAQALALTVPNVPSSVTVCRFAPADAHEPEGVRTHEVALADQIWSYVLARRFQADVRSEKPSFLRALSRHAEPFHVAGATCVVAQPLNDDWRAAVSSISDELRRLSAYGVTPQELSAASASIIAAVNQGVEAWPTIDAAPIAANILHNYQEDEVFDSPEEDRAIQLKALAHLDTGAILNAFHARWDAASAPIFVLVTPKPVSDEAILRTWTEAQARPAVEPAVRPQPRWGYTTFGAPGAVVRRESLHDPDFIRLTFANGLVVNFKQTPFAKDQVAIRVRFGAGQREVEPGRVWTAVFGAGLLLEGGLCRNSVQSLSDICAGHACALNFSVGRDAFELNGATRPSDLALELQLLGAFLTDPAFSGNLDLRIPSAVHAAYRQVAGNPAMMAALAEAKVLPPPHVVDLPTEAEAASITSEGLKALLKGPLETDALEVTMVGDVDEALATRLLAETLGALPPRSRIDRHRPDAANLVFPSTSPAPLSAPHQGGADKAAILFHWPLYVWSPSRLHEGRVLDLLSRVMREKIVDKIRRELGQTYTPSVVLSLERGGDVGVLGVVIETTPTDVRPVIQEMKTLAANLAGGAITDDDLEKARLPLLASFAKERSYNSWWLNELDGSFAYPDKLAFSRTRDQDVARISPEELRQEARRWLSRDPVIVYSGPGSSGPGKSAETLDPRPAASP